MGAASSVVSQVTSFGAVKKETSPFFDTFQEWERTKFLLFLQQEFRKESNYFFDALDSIFKGDVEFLAERAERIMTKWEFATKLDLVVYRSAAARFTTDGISEADTRFAAQLESIKYVFPFLFVIGYYQRYILSKWCKDDVAKEHFKKIEWDSDFNPEEVVPLTPMEAAVSGVGENEVKHVMTAHHIVLDRKKKKKDNSNPPPHWFELFTKLIDVVPVSLAMATSAQTKVVYGFPTVFVNKSFVQLTGYEPKECIGKNLKFLQHPPSDAPPTNERLPLLYIIPKAIYHDVIPKEDVPESFEIDGSTWNLDDKVLKMLDLTRQGLKSAAITRVFLSNISKHRPPPAVVNEDGSTEPYKRVKINTRGLKGKSSVWYDNDAFMNMMTIIPLFGIEDEYRYVIGAHLPYPSIVDENDTNGNHCMMAANDDEVCAEHEAEISIYRLVFIDALTQLFPRVLPCDQPPVKRKRKKGQEDNAI